MKILASRSRRRNGQEFVLVEFAGENVHFFCLFVIHTYTLSLTPLLLIVIHTFTHTYTHNGLFSSFRGGLKLQRDTPTEDGVSGVVTLFF